MQEPTIIYSTNTTTLYNDHTKKSGFGCGLVVLNPDEHIKLNGYYSFSNKTNPIVTEIFISVISGCGFVHVNGIEKNFSEDDSICIKVTSWENAFLMARERCKILVLERLHIEPGAESDIKIAKKEAPLLQWRFEQDSIDIWRDGDSVNSSIKVTRQKIKAGFNSFPTHGHIEGYEFCYVIRGKGHVNYKKTQKELAIYNGCFFSMPAGDAGFHRISASESEDLEVLCFANTPPSGTCYYETGVQMITASDPQKENFFCEFFIPDPKKENMYRKEEVKDFQEFCSNYYNFVYANGYIA